MFPSPGDLRHPGASYGKHPSLLEYPHCIMYSPNGARDEGVSDDEGYETPLRVAVDLRLGSRIREWMRKEEREMSECTRKAAAGELHGGRGEGGRGRGEKKAWKRWKKRWRRRNQGYRILRT